MYPGKPPSQAVALAKRALLWLSFGGPESADEIWPFLERVTANRGVPRERLEIVHRQYLEVGGASPINGQNRLLIHQIGTELAALGVTLPIYFGNRNWHPLLRETVAQMAADGIEDALAVATSAFGSFSGCLQYQHDLAEAQIPFHYTKLPPFAGHPEFQRALVETVLGALDGVDPLHTAFIATAHSIPVSMANFSPYERQLAVARMRLEAEISRVLGTGISIQQSFQSRSGSPAESWLEPDISAAITALGEKRPEVTTVVVIPIGFITDHQEVRYDLDVLARNAATAAGLEFVRTPTPGTSPLLPKLIADLTAAWYRGQNPAAQLPLEPPTCFPGCCRPHSA